MTDYVGDVVGAARAAVPPALVSRALMGGGEVVLVRDKYEAAAAVAQNDRVLLGSFKSDTVFNPITSIIWFDDFGTSVTMDVGSTAAENALVAAQDVAAAAGSCSFLKSVAIENLHKPLWQLLGLSADPGGSIDIYAKLEAANPDAGTLAWQVIGQ